MKRVAPLLFLVVSVGVISSSRGDVEERALKEKIMGCLRDPAPCAAAGMGGLGAWHSLHTESDDTNNLNSFRSCNYPKIEVNKPFTPQVILDDEVVAGFQKVNISVTSTMNSIFQGMVGVCRKGETYSKAVRDQVKTIHIAWTDKEPAATRSLGAAPIVTLNGTELVVTVYAHMNDATAGVATFLTKSLK
jgi:hypothetical protein